MPGHPTDSTDAAGRSGAGHRIRRIAHAGGGLAPHGSPRGRHVRPFRTPAECLRPQRRPIAAHPAPLASAQQYLIGWRPPVGHRYDAFIHRNQRGIGFIDKDTKRCAADRDDRRGNAGKGSIHPGGAPTSPTSAALRIASGNACSACASG